MRFAILFYLIFFVFQLGRTQSDGLYISGVIDGPLSGGTPKAIQLCATQDIPDLRYFGIGVANNGGGSDGVEFILFGSMQANECIWIATEGDNFESFFCTGCQPDFTISVVGINGDDAVELFYDPTQDFNFEDAELIDVFGDPDVDGSGTEWEYTDGWAYRPIPGSSTTFNSADWQFSGRNALDNVNQNAEADLPYPNPPTPPCGLTALGAYDLDCGGSGIVLEVPYEGMDPAAQLITEPVMENIGEDPTVVTDGRMRFRVQAGQSWSVQLRSEGCDLLEMSGRIALNACTNCPSVFGFINELNYDDPGADKLDFVEVFFPIVPPDAEQYTIQLFNGSNNQRYGSRSLADLEPIVRTEGVYFVWETPIQNGPDAVALFGPCGLVDAIAYEGAVSIDELTINPISVEELSSDSIQLTLQLLENQWIKSTATKGSQNTGLPNVVTFLDSCRCLLPEDQQLYDAKQVDILQVQGSPNQIWSVLDAPEFLIENTFTSGIQDGLDNDRDGSLDEQDEAFYYTARYPVPDNEPYRFQVSNGFQTFDVENTCSYALQCGNIFDFQAIATCENAIENEYFIELSKLNYDHSIELDAILVSFELDTFPATENRFGPFILDKENPVKPLSILGVQNDEIVYRSTQMVAGAVCGIGQNRVICNCGEKGAQSAGIIAQSIPGTFTTKSNEQWYLLLQEVDGQTTIQQANRTGHFEGVGNGAYQVAAINIEPFSRPVFENLIEGPFPQTLDLEALRANIGIFDGSCYSLCGLADFEVDCNCCFPNTIDGFSEEDISICEFALADSGRLQPDPIFIISEFDPDQAGADTEEFIEILGPPNTPLDGFSILLYNGSNESIYRTFDLDGFQTNEEGIFLIAGEAVSVSNIGRVESRTNQPHILRVAESAWLQNGTDAIVLATINNPDELANDVLIDFEDIIDAVVYGDDSHPVFEERFGRLLPKDNTSLSIGFDGNSYQLGNPNPGISSLQALDVRYTFYADEDGQIGSVLARNVSFYEPGPKAPGVYYYWIQVEDNTCVSTPVRIRYEVLNGPAPTEVFVRNQVSCVGQCEAENTILEATCDCENIANGVQNIRWFLDAQGDSLINTGTTFNPVEAGYAEIGLATTYTFYVNYDCGNGCPSPLEPVTLTFESCIPEEACQYFVEMKDAGCNGWSGGKLEFFENGTLKHTLTPDATNCEQGIYLSFRENAQIEVVYTPGIDASENYFQITSIQGEQVLVGGHPQNFGAEQSLQERFYANCSEVCVEPIAAEIVIEADRFIRNAGWEILEIQTQNVIASAEVGEYSDVAAGDLIRVPIELNSCRTYRLYMVDTFGKDWNGTFQIITNDANRGVLIEEGALTGNYELFFTDGDFNDGEEVFYLNFPCLPICTKQVVRTPSGCTLTDYQPTIPDIETCAYNSCGITDYQASVQITGQQQSATGYELEVGVYEQIVTYQFENGQVARCTSRLEIVPVEKADLVCNDKVNISLGECDYLIEPDDLLENTVACPGQFEIELKVEGQIRPSNRVTTDDVGKKIEYHLKRLGEEDFFCWGNINVEKKNSPTLICQDAYVTCTYPDLMETPISRVDTIRAVAGELPAAILSGTNSDPAIAGVPFNFDTCAANGVVLQDIEVLVDIKHNDVEDLAIWLETPMGDRFQLLPALQCRNQRVANLRVLFSEEGAFDLPCSRDSLIGVEGVLKPVTTFQNLIGQPLKNFTGIWKLEIFDNDNNENEGFGFGSIENAYITIKTGLPIPKISGTCENLEPEMVQQRLVETNCKELGIGAYLEREWQVVNSLGMKSSCTQKLNLIAPTLRDIEFPKDTVLMLEEPILSDSIKPMLSGTPMFGCFPVEKSQHDICDIAITYEDKHLKSCGAFPTFMRIWQVVNCCTNVIRRDTQFIETKGGAISLALLSDTLTSGYFGCYSEALPEVAVEGVALDDLSYLYLEVETEDGMQEINLKDSSSIELKLGTYPVTLVGKGTCTGETRIYDTLTVIDGLPPVAVCDNIYRLTLGSNGEAILKASDFDEGSYDNCGIDKILIRRASRCVFQRNFETEARFDCCDVGRSTKVELKVIDVNGFEQICWGEVEVEDPLEPQLICPTDTMVFCNHPGLADMQVFGQPQALDNCNRNTRITNLPMQTEVDSLGRTVYLRRWTATDGSETSLSDTCYQRITLLPSNDYTVMLPPLEVTMYGCVLDSIPAPLVEKGACDNIIIKTEDTRFERDNCLEIIRKYTILNENVYDPNAQNTALGTLVSDSLRVYKDDGDGYFEFNQLIQVRDTIAPILELDSLQFETQTCSYKVQYKAIGVDDCSAELDYNYEIWKDSIIDSGKDSIDVELPVGEYIVRWIATDACGNKGIGAQSLVIKDGKAPTPVCYEQLETVLMENGMVTLAADKFIKDATDNCTSKEALLQSVALGKVGENHFQKELTISCADIQNGIVDLIIQIEDAAGNKGYCSFELEVAAPSCPESLPILSGRLVGFSGSPFDNVAVYANGAANYQTYSNTEGQYVFNDVATNQAITLAPLKDDEMLKGVSTLDIVYIQQHLLGKDEFEQPTQMLAADVDHSGAVSVGDLVELSRLLLGKQSSFNNNTSYQFFSTRDSIAGQDARLVLQKNYQNQMDIKFLDRPMVFDFEGLKTGDVSGEVVQSRTTTSLTVEDKELIQGNPEDIALHLEEGYYEGGQLSLVYDKAIEVKDVVLNISKDLYNIYHDEAARAVRISFWEPFESYESLPIMKLKIATNQAITVKEAFKLETSFQQEMYSDKLAIKTIQLKYQGEKGLNFGNNYPNPFNAVNYLPVYAPKAQTIDFEVVNLQGQLIYKEQKTLLAGENALKLEGNKLPGKGIYYYKVTTKNYTFTQKVVLK